MTMTTKELLALVDRWGKREVEEGQAGNEWDAAIYRECADELAPIATALCARLDACEKVIDALNNASNTDDALAAGMLLGCAQHMASDYRAAIDAAKEPK